MQVIKVGNKIDNAFGMIVVILHLLIKCFYFIIKKRQWLYNIIYNSDYNLVSGRFYWINQVKIY